MTNDQTVTQAQQFEREERYIVFKKSHLTQRQLDMLDKLILPPTIPPANWHDDHTLPTVECVVVEKDWPEYETVWKLIEARMTAHSGEGRSNGAGEDDLRLARGTVEAYLVERLRGEGYGPARRIIDARKYDPTSDDYWVNAEAKNNHRVTPLAALSAPQGEVERLREALGDQIADAVERRIATEFKGFWAREDLVDEIPGMIREEARAALAQPEAGGDW